MDLETLFIRINTQYSGSDSNRAIRDTDRLTNSVGVLHNALKRVALAANALNAAALTAFSNYDRALITLAGRAGMTRDAFSAVSREASRAASIATGVSRTRIMEGIQQALVLQVTPEEAQKIARVGAQLESTGQADLIQTVASAVALANVTPNLGPAEVAQMQYRAAQIGAGNAPEYAADSLRASGMARFLGVDLPQVLAGMGVVRENYSMSESVTQLDAFFSMLAKPLTGARAAAFERATGGKRWSDLQEIAREPEVGFANALRFIAEEIPKEMIPEIFSEREVQKFLGGVLDNIDKIEANTLIVRRAPEDDAIGKHTNDALESFFVQVRRLWQALGAWAVQIGEPIAKFLTPFIRWTVDFLDWLVRLDDTLFRLISTGAAMIGPLAAVAVAIPVLRNAIDLAKGAFDLLKPKRGVDGDADTDKNKGKSGGALQGVGIGGALVSLGALLGKILGTPFVKMWEWMKGLFARVLGAFGGASLLLRRGQTPGRIIDPNTMRPMAYRNPGLARAFALLAFWAAVPPMVKGILAAVIASAGLLMFIHKDTEAVRRIRENDIRTRELQQGVPYNELSDPRELDIARANRERARIALERVSDEFWSQVGSWFDANFPTLRLNFERIRIGLDKFSSWGALVAEFLWKVWKAPELMWNRMMTYFAGENNEFYRWLGEHFGFTFSGQANHLTNKSNLGLGTSLDQGYITMSPENAAKIFEDIDKMALPVYTFESQRRLSSMGSTITYSPITNITIEGSNLSPQELEDATTKAVSKENEKNIWGLIEQFDSATMSP